MSVRIVPARSGKGFTYDIWLNWTEGGRDRERANCPRDVRNDKAAARAWAEEHERKLLAAGKAAYLPPRAVARAARSAPSAVPPALGNFWPRFVRDHYRAEKRKPSTIAAAESAYRLYLHEALGSKRLNTISNADIAKLKGALTAKSPKTANNVLSVLSACLHAAVDWSIIAAMPCRIRLLKVMQPRPDWYEREEYARLVDAASGLGTAHLVLVLLAGDAGLRRGEIISLKWSDLDQPRGRIHVERSIVNGEEGTPKGGRGRVVPMTPRLVEALKAHRHPRERVLCNVLGYELSNRIVRNWLASAERRAGLKLTSPDGRRRRDRGGAIHVLRHTFCSHLAIAGAPVTAIQALAGHQNLTTTMRYMHLSPKELTSATETLASYRAEGNEVAKQDAKAVGPFAGATLHFNFYGVQGTADAAAQFSKLLEGRLTRPTA